MSGRPDALLFDVFGTVVDWRSGVIREVSAAAAAAGVALDAAAFADAWRAEYQPAMEAVRSGARPFTVLDRLHAESLDRQLAQFGVAAAFDAAARADLTRAWWRLDPWPDSVAGLTRLKRVAFIAPCSNGGVALLAHMAKRAGLPWDAILGAEPARAYKPQPEAYLAAVAMAGTVPERAMMVAAHNDDLEAARALGLRTAFIPRPREHGAAQTTDLAPTGPWDLAASDLEDLAAALDA